jgi:hypothetical protein
MKSKRRTTIPPNTPRNVVRIVPRREPAHPVVGRQLMSLARALTEPMVRVEENSEGVEIERVVRRRRAA